MIDTELSDLPAVVTPDATDVFYVVQAGVPKQVAASQLSTFFEDDNSALTDHLEENDPFVHNADHIASGSTVGTGDVEGDLDALDADKASLDEITDLFEDYPDRVSAIEDLLGGMPDDAQTGVHGRYLWRDDFLSSNAVGTSGSIGERGWFSTGATTTRQALSAFRPGGVRVASASPTFASLYAAQAGMFNGSLFFDYYVSARMVTVDANTEFWLGLTSDGSTQTPTEGLYLKKRTTDSTVWQLGKTVASTETLAASAISLPASNIFVHLHIRRVDASNVGFSIMAADSNAWGTEETIAYSSTTQLIPFVAIKSSSGTKNTDIDYAILHLHGLAR